MNFEFCMYYSTSNSFFFCHSCFLLSYRDNNYLRKKTETKESVSKEIKDESMKEVIKDGSIEPGHGKSERRIC